MQKFIRCFFVLTIGFTIIVAACTVGHCWPELPFFTGSVLVTALIVSAIVNDSEKQRHRGSAAVFWAGIVTLLIHLFIYSVPSAVSPVHSWVLVVCFIEGTTLSLLIYYLRISVNTEPALPSPVQPN